MDKQDLIEQLKAINYGAIILLEDGDELSVLRKKDLLKMKTSLGWMLYSEDQLADELTENNLQVVHVEVC